MSTRPLSHSFNQFLFTSRLGYQLICQSRSYFIEQRMLHCLCICLAQICWSNKKDKVKFVNCDKKRAKIPS